MLHNPYKIVKMFEEEVAYYTGAPYAISIDSCTNAIFLCCKYLQVKEVIIPSRTYVSIPCSIKNAGGKVKFDERHWEGIYQLKPYPIYDAAKRFTKGMYINNTFMCLSFHIKKHLKIGKGGMILTSSNDAVKWFKQARYEGRHELAYHKDKFEMIGWNMYMTPEQAARGLTLMQNIPDNNDDLPETLGYQNLDKYDIYY